MQKENHEIIILDFFPSTNVTKEIVKKVKLFNLVETSVEANEKGWVKRKEKKEAASVNEEHILH